MGGVTDRDIHNHMVLTLLFNTFSCTNMYEERHKGDEKHTVMAREDSRSHCTHKFHEEDYNPRLTITRSSVVGAEDKA